MKVVEIVVENKLGFHARPAGMIVKTASAYDSEILIESENKTANAKSMMSILGMGVSRGDKITVKAAGADEDNALEALGELINSGFGE